MKITNLDERAKAAAKLLPLLKKGFQNCNSRQAAEMYRLSGAVYDYDQAEQNKPTKKW